MANIIFIDNFDSFTYNLVDQFRSLGHNVTIYRNNIAAQNIEHAVNQLENPVCFYSLQDQERPRKLVACQSLSNV